MVRAHHPHVTVSFEELLLHFLDFHSSHCRVLALVQGTTELRTLVVPPTQPSDIFLQLYASWHDRQPSPTMGRARAGPFHTECDETTGCRLEVVSTLHGIWFCHRTSTRGCRAFFHVNQYTSSRQQAPTYVCEAPPQQSSLCMKKFPSLHLTIQTSPWRQSCTGPEKID